MPTRTAEEPSAAKSAPTARERGRMPLVVYVLALGTFLMLTTEFVVAGILPEVATDLGVRCRRPRI
jgi:predicted MFS family arabinose efflux permease